MIRILFQKEATRLKEQRECTDGEIGRLKLAEEEIDHVSPDPGLWSFR
jgi:hypothetical protein